jgi:transcriptional repressor NrdR
MKCPKCGGRFSEVVKNRPRDDGRVLTRRRECLKQACKHRWSTVEFESQKVVAYLPKAGR